MADQGDVDYNVSLNSDGSGLEKSINRIISAMESLENSISQSSKTMENAFNNLSKSADNTGKKATKSMEGVSKSMKDAESSIQPSIVKLMDLTKQYDRASQAAKNVGDSSGMRKAADAMDYYKQRVENGFESTAQLSAETSRLTRALGEVEKESNRYNQAMIAMEKTIGNADREVAMLTSRMKAMGASEEEITPLSDALKRYKEDLEGAGGSQRLVTEAQERYKTSLGEVKNSMEEQRKSIRGGSSDQSEFVKQMQNSTKAVQLALGPLSGVASRITAFTALLKTNTLSVAAFTASVTGLLVATNKIINVGIEYERQMLAMDSSIQATGRSAETTAGEMDALAISIASATLTSSTKARQAINVLMTYSNISVEMFENIATAAQGVASTFGGDIVSSTRLLARAIEQPANSLDSLRRVGIQFTDSQKELIRSFERTGQVARAQNVIMERVAVFNESAQAQAKGLAGQLDAVGDNMQTLMEKISSQVQTNQKLSEAYQVVNNMLTDLIENSDAVVGLFDAIGAVVGVSAKGLRILGENYEFVFAAMSMVVAGAAVKMVGILSSIIGLNKANIASTVQYTQALYAKATAARTGAVSLTTMATAARGLMAALGPFALALSAGVATLALLKSRTGETSDAMRAYQNMLSKTSGDSDAFADSQKSAADSVRRVTTEMVAQANMKLLELGNQYRELETSLQGMGESIGQSIQEAMPSNAAIGSAYRTISFAAGKALDDTKRDLQQFGSDINSAIQQVSRGVSLTTEEIVALGQEAQRLGLDADFTRLLQQFPVLREQIAATGAAAESTSKAIGQFTSDPEALFKGLSDTFGDLIYDFDALENRINEIEFTRIINNTDAAVTAIENKFAPLIVQQREFAREMGATEEEVQALMITMNGWMDEAIAGVNNLEKALKDARTEGVRDFAQEVTRSFQLINASSDDARKSLENAFTIEDSVDSAIESMLNGRQSMGDVVEQAIILEQSLYGTAAAFLVNVDAIRESENPLETFRSQLTAIAEASQVFTRSSGSSTKAAKSQSSSINSLVKQFEGYNNTLQQYQALQDGGNSARLNAIAMQEEAEAIKSIDDALKDLSAGQLQKFVKETGIVVKAGESVREAMIRMYNDSTKASKQLETQVDAIDALEQGLRDLAAEADNASRRMEALTRGGVAELDRVVGKLEAEDKIKEIIEAFNNLGDAAKQDFVRDFNNQLPGLNANLGNFEEHLLATSESINAVEQASEDAREMLDEFDGVIESIIDRQKNVDALFKSLSNPFMTQENVRGLRNAVESFEKMTSGEQFAQLEKMRNLFPTLTWEVGTFAASMQKAFEYTTAQEEWANAWATAVQDSSKVVEDTITGTLSGTISSFSDAANEIKNIFKNLLADLLYQAAAKPILVGLKADVSDFMSGKGGISNTMSGLSKAGQFFGLGGKAASAASSVSSLGMSGGLSGTAISSASQVAAGASQGVMSGVMAGMKTAMPWIAGGLAVDSLLGGSISKGITDALGGMFGSKTNPRLNVSTYGERSAFNHDSVAESSLGVVGFGKGTRKSDELFGSVEAEREWLDSVAAMDEMLAVLAKTPAQLDDMKRAVQGVHITAKDAASANDMLVSRTKAAASMLNNDFLISIDRIGITAEEVTQRFVAANNALNVLSSASERLNLQFNSSADNALFFADSLAQMVGGVENLQNSQARYYDAFFTQEEKLANVTNDLTSAFGNLGMHLPDSREGVRSLVEGLDLMSDAGQRQLATIYNNHDGLVQYIESMEEQRASMEESTIATEANNIVQRDAADIAKERGGLEKRYLELIGDTYTLRLREWSALDESNRALQDKIWMLEDEREAQEATKRAQEELNRVREQAAQAEQQRMNARLQLENEYLNAIGDTEELRRRELAATDPANKALRKWIWTVNDLTSAMDSAQQRLSNAHSDVANAFRSFDQSAFQQQVQLLELIGDKEGALALQRKRELKELDPLLHATQKYLWSIEDEMLAKEQLQQASKNYVNELSRVKDQLSSTLGGISQWIDQRNATSGAPEVNLDAASKQFSEQLKLANSGDRNALQNITGYADRYLQAAEGVFASGTGFQKVEKDILKQLSKLPEALKPEEFLAKEIKEALKKVIIESMPTDSSLAFKLTGELERLDKNQLTKAQVYDALSPIATNAEIKSLIKAVDINGDGIITSQELLNFKLSGLADNIGNVLGPMFDNIDLNEDSLIDWNEFHSAFNGLASENQLKNIFNQLDKNGDGTLKKLDYVGKTTGDTEGNTKSIEERSKSQLQELTWLVDEMTRSANASVNLNSGMRNLTSAIYELANAQEQMKKVQQEVANAEKTKQQYDKFMDQARRYDRSSQDSYNNAKSMKVALPQTTIEVIEREITKYNSNGSFSQSNYNETLKRLEKEYGKNSAAYRAGEQYAKYYRDMTLANENRQQANKIADKFANGGTFTNGIVSKPTNFNMGLMGEAGSEAIMPLANIGGGLGVKAILPDMNPTFDGAIENGLRSLQQEMRAMRNDNNSRLDNLEEHAAASVRVQQEGHNQQIALDKEGNRYLQESAKNSRLEDSKR